MIGIVDIGSNTVRFSCYRIEESSFYCMVHKKEVAGLAGYILKDGSMSNEGIRKAVDTLNSFKGLIDVMPLKELEFIATAAIRNTVNTDEIVAEIKNQTGYDIKVISGEEEAICDFEGATSFGKETEGMVIDIGGGSTELVFFKNKKIQDALSMHIGSLNIYKEHVKKIIPKKEEIKNIILHVEKEIEKTGINKAPADFTYGVGGTVRAVCKIYNELFNKTEDNIILEAQKLSELLKMSRTNRKLMSDIILRVAPERIHTLIPGLTILCTVLEKYKIKVVRVSRYGVREGYLIRHVINKNKEKTTSEEKTEYIENTTNLKKDKDKRNKK